MMNLYQLLGTIEDMSNFQKIDDFSDFAKNFFRVHILWRYAGEYCI